MVEARGLHKSLPSVKIVYCTMEVKLMIKKQESLREFYRSHFCLGNPRGRSFSSTSLSGDMKIFFIVNIL